MAIIPHRHDERDREVLGAEAVERARNAKPEKPSIKSILLTSNQVNDKCLGRILVSKAGTLKSVSWAIKWMPLTPGKKQEKIPGQIFAQSSKTSQLYEVEFSAPFGVVTLDWYFKHPFLVEVILMQEFKENVPSPIIYSNISAEFTPDERISD